MQKKRTDLALESRESFPEDDVEIKGVVLEKESFALDRQNNYYMDISKVKILNDEGAEKMGKPKGTYITLETGDICRLSGEGISNIEEKLKSCIEELCGSIYEQRIMVCGLGNRHITADSIGPLVIDKLNVTGHFVKEFGMDFLKSLGVGELYAIAPGVMAQTGMEAASVVKSLVKIINPDILIAVDSLAARSVSRVGTTIQVTDTGINPGSGVGNHRIGLNEEGIGIKVLAIGIPTVMESGIDNMYITPKNIDETVNLMSKLTANVINKCQAK